MSKNLFITGTGTDIGKTYVTGLIMKKLNDNLKNPAYFKMAMSGNERDHNGILIPGDAVHVKNVSGIKQPLDEMCPYVYENAVSPHLASQIEGNPVDMETILKKYDDICKKYEYVTVEGSGGIVCPIRFDDNKFGLIDFIKSKKIACLIVADAGLGTINSVVLTVEYMRTHGINIKGLMFNNYEPENRMHEDNLFMCEYITGVKVIACIKSGDKELDAPFELIESLYE